MNRIEFMNELEYLLQDIEEEEKQEALQYYNDYFDEAGSDNEAELISELESPAKVAAIIKDGLGEEVAQSGEFSEKGYNDERFARRQEIDRRTYLKESGYNYQNFREQRRSDQRGGGAYDEYVQPDQGRSTSTKVLLIVLACLLAIPAGSVLIALGAAVIGIIFGLGGALVGLLVAGIALVGTGIGVMFTLPSAGLAISGVGLILSAAGLVLVVLVVWLTAEALPALIRAVKNLCSRISGRGGERR